jgi:hypothetical protein
MLLLLLFLSFRSSYLGLPIDRAFALLLTHHRSIIDRVRDTIQPQKKSSGEIGIASIQAVNSLNAAPAESNAAVAQLSNAVLAEPNATVTQLPNAALAEPNTTVTQLPNAALAETQPLNTTVAQNQRILRLRPTKRTVWAAQTGPTVEQFLEAANQLPQPHNQPISQFIEAVQSPSKRIRHLRPPKPPSQPASQPKGRLCAPKQPVSAQPISQASNQSAINQSAADQPAANQPAAESSEEDDGDMEFETNYVPNDDSLQYSHWTQGPSHPKKKPKKKSKSEEHSKRSAV